MENDKPIYFPKKDQMRYHSFGLPANMTIGVEIETEGEMNKIFICHKRNIYGWKCKEERGLWNALEVISPILQDKPEEVSSIYKVTETLKESGFMCSIQCGGHIHIGVDYLKSVEAIKELLEIFGNAEKILYLISNQPGEVSRCGILAYARPISSEIERNLFRK